MPPKPDLIELPTQSHFTFPDFVDPEKIGLKIIDAGYTASHPDTKKPDDTEFKFLSSYINGPFIIDDIADHRKHRNGWEEEQSEEVQQLLNRNRIGINSISRAYVSFCLFFEEPDSEVYLDIQTIEEMKNLVDYIDENKNQVIRTENKDGSATFVHNPNYDKLSVSQKIALVNRITKISIEILRQNGFTVEKRSFNQPDLS